MKRIFSVFAAGLMVAATIISCNGKKDDTTPGDDGTKAPVLGEIPNAVLDAKGGDFQITYQPADFGVSAAITHELWVAKAGEEMVGEVQVKAAIEKEGITLKQSILSLALQKLGFAVGEDAEVEFALYGYLGSSRGTAALRSNLVKASFTVCAAKQDDSGLDKIEVIGDFDGWSSEGVEKAGAYLYKYGETNVYSGLVYYYAKAVNGWKLRVPTAEGGWDDSANWGIDETQLNDINAQAKELYDSDPSHPELTKLTLACAGSSKDMKIFNHNFYFWIFDRDENILEMDVLDTWESKQAIAFDYMYLVGTFNSWKEFDENYKMKYIPKQHTFYLDVTLSDNAEIKFMADGQASNKWYIQWAKGEEDGKAAFQGDNIKVEKGGNYRVYFDVNHLEYSLDADAYGKEEEGGVDVAERELDRPDEYFIVGNVMGKTWDDVNLGLNRNSETGIYTYYGLSYKVGEAFKVVKNQKAEWYGVGAMEPYTGTRNTLTGTDNFEFSKASGFDVSFNPTTGKVTIADSAIPGWGVKGNIKVDGKDDAWNKTFPMTQDGDIWTSEELEFLYDGTSTWGFKLCLYGNWDAGDVGVAEGTNPQAGVAIPAVDKLVEGKNSNINFNGKARVQFDTKNMTITLLVK